MACNEAVARFAEPAKRRRAETLSVQSEFHHRFQRIQIGNVCPRDRPVAGISKDRKICKLGRGIPRGHKGFRFAARSYFARFQVSRLGKKEIVFKVLRKEKKRPLRYQ
jgi:hypothetical protein